MTDEEEESNIGCRSEGVEQCVPWKDNTTQQIDLAFNIFFMVYFFIRVGVVPLGLIR